jgi:hypothetical protein
MMCCKDNCRSYVAAAPSTMWLKKWHAWIVGLLVLLFLRIHLSMEFLLTTTYEMVHKCTSMLWGVLRHDILCFVQQLKRSDQIDPISNIYPQHVSVHHSNSCSTSFGDSTIQRVIERLSFHCPSGGGYSGLVPPQANDVVTSVNGTYHKPKHPMCVLCTRANLDRGRSTVSLAESWKTKR